MLVISTRAEVALRVKRGQQPEKKPSSRTLQNMGGIAAIVWKVYFEKPIFSVSWLDAYLDSREPTGRSLDLIARTTIRGTVRSLYGNDPLDRTEVYPRDRCSNNRPSVVSSRENPWFHIIATVVKLFHWSYYFLEQVQSFEKRFEK